jgi:hypothetical protein
MSDEPNNPKSTPGQDVKKAFGLLYRAARNAVDQLPTKKVEEAVAIGAKEVGRAIENVASTLEKEIFRSSATRPTPSTPPPPPDVPEAKPEHEPTPPKGDA